MTATPASPLSLFNLRESPYFQDALQASGRHPLSLFVGREDATGRLLKKIEMNPGGTRQTIRGPIGVGKSTLAAYVKTEAAHRFSLLSAAKAASLGSATTTDQLCALVLRSVTEALLVGATDFGIQIDKEPAFREASQLARIYQTTTGRSGGAGALGFSGSMGSSETLVTPSAATPSVVIQDLLPQLMEIARVRLGADGVLLHLNNLDNVPAAQADRAAVILRDVRDTALMVDGYHWLVVGTGDAVRTIVDGTPQLRSVFHRPPALAPLTDAELAALLDKRYNELRADPDRPFRRPVEAEAVTDLYHLYGGDLRGTFEALDAAISQLLGTSIHGASASLSLGDMAPFLTGWAQEQAQDQLGERGLDDLTRLAQTFGDTPFTRAMLQKDIMHTKNIATAAEFTDKLLRFGYIAEYPERLQSGGRPAVQYLTTGTTRLVIGTAYTWDPPA